jgi:DNA-directed RNA polymerase specialized sigma24 family protein
VTSAELVSASNIAASRWRRVFSVGVPVMDADDARQDAALGMIEAGQASPVVGYRRAIDAVRRLTHRGALRFDHLHDYEAADPAPTPEQAAQARESLALIERMPQAQVLAGVLAGESSVALAARHGITRGRVSQIVAAAVRQLTDS